MISIALRDTTSPRTFLVYVVIVSCAVVVHWLNCMIPHFTRKRKNRHNSEGQMQTCDWQEAHVSDHVKGGVSCATCVHVRVWALCVCVERRRRPAFKTLLDRYDDAKMAPPHPTHSHALSHTRAQTRSGHVQCGDGVAGKLWTTWFATFTLERDALSYIVVLTQCTW